MNNESKKERQKVVLAALLHDIGKFWERADDKYDQSQIIKSEFPNKEYNHTVPLYDSGYPKYSHALWTQAFLHKFKIGELLKFDEKGDQNLATLAARHHKPTNHLEGIISLADKWSSSIDRPDEGEEGVQGYTKIKEKWGDGFNKKVPLFNLFDQIQVGKENKKSDTQNSFKIAKLNVLNDSSLFSNETVPSSNSNLSPTYKEHWSNFEKEINALIARCNEFDSFYISLCDILRNYTWCIPSATNLEPSNVSLYDHLKTTAALAISIYDYYDFLKKEINYSGKLDSNTKNEDALMMLCIDISGIQKFIYDIANKKAAKSLKGRSFYLQLLMQHVIDSLLNHDDIQAFSTNVIYASGGKAYIVLPNLDRVKKAIEEVDHAIQEYVWDNFKGKIYVVFGHVAFNYQTFINQKDHKWANYVESNDFTDKERLSLRISANDKIDLGHLWRLVSDRAAANKYQKFLQKVLEYDKLFNPQESAYGKDKCAVTGERGDLVDLYDGKEVDELLVLQSVYDQSQLGDALKNGNSIVSYFNRDETIIHNFKLDTTLFEIKDGEKIKNLPINQYSKACVKIFNSADQQVTSPNVGVSTFFYGGNRQPLLENSSNEYKTFEDLAKNGNGNTTKLAILRMDVDNLGQVFINGFDNTVQKKSFAAYSTLSFMLDAFFSGHINYIHQKNETFRDYIQILYSGGDDLFAVGRWDAIIDFAAEVRNQFAKFVCRNDITISGGIAIVGAKYPIMKSAEIAGDLEKEAKSFNNETKNAINFFGETISWDKEFDFVRSLKDQLLYFEGDISSALLQNVQKYKIIKDVGNKSEIKTGKKDLSYIWNSAYTIKRTLDRMNKEKQKGAYNFVESIAENIIHNKEYGSERYLDLLALGARWAEYLIKDKLINNNKINL